MPKTTKKQIKNDAFGWKIATIISAVLAIFGCTAATVLFISTQKDIDSESDAFAALEKIVAPDDGYEYGVKYDKKGTTKDGKYYYAFVNSSIKDLDGAWGRYVYYRRATKGAEWKYYNISNDSNPLYFPYCKDITGDLDDFIKNYDYLDDDTDAVWVTCWKEGDTY